jgi:hypothetical protein
MNNTDILKDSINLRDVVRNELSQQPKVRAKYDEYLCPFHTEKTPSFVVYDRIAICMGACGTKMDVFAFIQGLRNLDFRQAHEYVVTHYLHGAALPDKKIQVRQPERPPSTLPNEEWQSAAHQVVTEAQYCLWSATGAKAMRYLTEVRGLNRITIELARLGYVAGEATEWRKIAGLSVPCGITIPWLNRGSLWGIKVRRAIGTPKYVQVGGGNLAGGLYLCDEIQPGLPLVIDEGELNALSMLQAQMECGQEIVSPVAIGSTGNAAINLRWYGVIAAAPRVFARMDAGSGDKAAAKLGSLSAAVRSLSVPVGWKDPNEFLLSSGNEAVFEWLALAASGEVVR